MVRTFATDSGSGGQSGGEGASGSEGGAGSSEGQSGEGEGDRGSQDPNNYGFTGAFDPETARALINKLRPFEEKAKTLEQEREALVKELEGYRESESSELENANRRLEASIAEQEKLAQENRQLKVRVIAGEFGIVDTQAASVLLKWDELGDTPEEETVRQALKQLVADRPWLKGQASQTPQVPKIDATNPGRQNKEPHKKVEPGMSRIAHALNRAMSGKQQ